MEVYANQSIILATAKNEKQEYSLKVINLFDGLNGIDKDKEMKVMNEISILKSFNHKNVLKLHDSF